jgi:hypothetical protein
MRKRVVSLSPPVNGVCVAVDAPPQSSLQQAVAGASGLAVLILMSMP